MYNIANVYLVILWKRYIRRKFELNKVNEMAKCEICGKDYYTRECLKCRNKAKIYPPQQKIYPSKQKIHHTKIENEDAEVIKIKKSNIQYVIAGALVVIALVLIYKEYRQEQVAIEMMNKLGQELKPYNDSMKKSLRNLDKLNDKLYRDLNRQCTDIDIIEVIQFFKLQDNSIKKIVLLL